jgi:hypothetical protein
VVAPADLVDDPPATAIVLNPVYVGKIERQLAELGLRTLVVTIEDYAEPTTRPEPARIG